MKFSKVYFRNGRCLLEYRGAFYSPLTNVISVRGFLYIHNRRNRKRYLTQEWKFAYKDGSRSLWDGDKSDE